MEPFWLPFRLPRVEPNWLLLELKWLLLELYWLPLERRFPLERQLYLGAAMAPSMGAELAPFLELTRLLSGGSFWSRSGYLFGASWLLF